MHTCLCLNGEVIGVITIIPKANKNTDKRAMRSVGYETHELCSLVSDKNSNSDVARCRF